MYSALEIAKYLIWKSSQPDENRLTNLKLQKILYYAQGWYLANFSTPLFEEKIEAWKYGPAIPDVYQAYKGFVSNPIDTVITDEDLNNIDQDTKDFLDEVWKVYGKLTGPELVFLTHKEEPWIKARSGNLISESSNSEISIGMLEDYFRQKIKNG